MNDVDRLAGLELAKESAWHGGPDAIAHFRPFSHFGSRRSAHDRLSRTLEEGERAVLTEVRIAMGNPLLIHDAGGDGNVIEIGWCVQAALEMGVAEMGAALSPVMEGILECDPGRADWYRENGMDDAEIWLDMCESKDSFVLMRNRELAEIVGEDAVRQAFANVDGILRARGHDGLVYVNRHEDDGSISWIVPSGTQLTILSTVEVMIENGNVKDLECAPDQASAGPGAGPR